MADTTDVAKLLEEVRAYFPHGEEPYTSANSPDVKRYHVYSFLHGTHYQFDTEAEIREFIGKCHLEIAREFIDLGT